MNEQKRTALEAMLKNQNSGQGGLLPKLNPETVAKIK
jgi:hypothetical protein